MPPFAVPPRAVPRTGDDTPAASLLSYVWRMSGWHQVALCVLAGVVACLSLAPLELQRRLINGAIGDRQIELLVWLGTLYLLVLLVHGGLKLFLRLYQGWLAESAVRYNRAHLSRLLHDGSTGSDDNDNGNSSGKAVSIIGAEVDRLGGFVGEGLSQPVVNLGMLLAIGSYMIVVEPLIALLSLVFLLPQALIIPLTQIRLNRLIEQRIAKIRELSDAVDGIHDSGCGHDGALSDDRLDGIYGNRMQIYVLKFLAKAAVNLLSGLAPLAVLLAGGILVIQGETTVGVLVAFVSGFERLSNPLRELLTYYRVAAQAGVQHAMIARWMS